MCVFIVLTLLVTWQLYDMLTKFGTPDGRPEDRDQLRNPEILKHVDIKLLDKLEKYSKVCTCVRTYAGRHKQTNKSVVRLFVERVYYSQANVTLHYVQYWLIVQCMIICFDKEAPFGRINRRSMNAGPTKATYAHIPTHGREGREGEIWGEGRGERGERG